MNQEKITEYLYDCRWCNFKKDIENGHIINISLERMPYDNGNKMFVIGEAEIEGGTKKYFSMPLAKKAAIPQDKKVIIMDGEIYTDALNEPDFWSSLIKLVDEHNGEVKFANGWTLERHNIAEAEIIDDCVNETSKPLGVEQSNTTLNIGGGKLAFKLERMLEFSDEINSEFEMNEKLMRENSTVMPKSFGGFIWRAPNGQQASFGIVQEFVKNKGDMWGYLLGYLEPRLQDGYLHQKDLTAADNPEFMTLIRRLSDRTQDMSDCLGAPDSNLMFSPEKVDDTFIRNYEKQFIVLLNRTKRNIESRLDNLPLDTRRQAENILASWDESTSLFLNSRLDKVRASEDKGVIHRVHGDFHLGQVMVTPDNDLKFIDFAGEPDLPMAQRKQKHLSVRDVAGMYRSIKGYLKAVAVENFAAKSSDVEQSLARKAWAEKAISPLIDRASQAFLGQKTMSDPWLSLEVLRKNLYEVNYEVGNRPLMAYVPISGLSQLLGTSIRGFANENIKTTEKTGTER